MYEPLTPPLRGNSPREQSPGHFHGLNEAHGIQSHGARVWGGPEQLQMQQISCIKSFSYSYRKKYLMRNIWFWTFCPRLYVQISIHELMQRCIDGSMDRYVDEYVYVCLYVTGNFAAVPAIQITLWVRTTALLGRLSGIFGISRTWSFRLAGVIFSNVGLNICFGDLHLSLCRFPSAWRPVQHGFSDCPDRTTRFSTRQGIGVGRGSRFLTSQPGHSDTFVCIQLSTCWVDYSKTFETEHPNDESEPICFCQSGVIYILLFFDKWFQEIKKYFVEIYIFKK